MTRVLHRRDDGSTPKGRLKNFTNKTADLSIFKIKDTWLQKNIFWKGFGTGEDKDGVPCTPHGMSRIEAI